LLGLDLTFAVAKVSAHCVGRKPTTTENQSEAFVIERALVSNWLYNKIVDEALPRESREKLEKDVVYNRQPNDVNALLVLFDSMQSEASERILANLGSYYLGESAGELYECVVLRKGKRMVPYLRRELRYSDCARQTRGKYRNLCRSRANRQAYLGSIIQQLHQGKGCPDTDPSIDYALHAPLPDVKQPRPVAPSTSTTR
jgi:hypothetical protein